METLFVNETPHLSTRARAAEGMMSLPSSSSSSDAEKQLEKPTSNPKDHELLKVTSDAAANELWNSITSSPPTNLQPTPRYTRAQVNRTLIHPNLPQPTTEDEKIHQRKISMVNPAGFSKNSLVCGECNEESNNESQAEADLRSRLSEALLIGSYKASDEEIRLDKHGNLVDDGAIHDASPTSTLNFPDPILAQHATRPTTEIDRHSPHHSFVVCADSQIGMTSGNKEWDTELNYCRQAIARINSLEPRPKFVSICGDLIDMEHTFYQKPDSKFTKEECDEIQDKQNQDFKDCWEELHPNIAVVCICGNHDIGNRPTAESIQRFKSAFGDEYLSFWVNGTFNIVLNNVLFSDPTGAPDIFEEQLTWLEGRLRYARTNNAAQTFIFGHHPFFLYHEDENSADLLGSSALPPEWNPPSGATEFPDTYFAIEMKYRKLALDLFHHYGVNACFVGHFHQNLLSKTEWGMHHIITAPLSMVFDSSGKPPQQEINDRGIRIVDVRVDMDGGNDSSFTHRFEKL